MGTPHLRYRVPSLLRLECRDKLPGPLRREGLVPEYDLTLWRSHAGNCDADGERMDVHELGNERHVLRFFLLRLSSLFAGVSFLSSVSIARHLTQ